MWLLIVYALFGFTGFFVTISALPAWLAFQGTAESLTGLVTTTLLASTVITQIMVQRLKRLLGLTTTLAVGAVALDSGGNLAAGTSTGGIDGQKVGRIGDSPLPGGKVTVAVLPSGRERVVAGAVWAAWAGEPVGDESGDVGRD